MEFKEKYIKRTVSNKTGKYKYTFQMSVVLKTKRTGILRAFDNLDDVLKFREEMITLRDLKGNQGLVDYNEKNKRDHSKFGGVKLTQEHRDFIEKNYGLIKFYKTRYLDSCDDYPDFLSKCYFALISATVAYLGKPDTFRSNYTFSYIYSQYIRSEFATFYKYRGKRALISNSESDFELGSSEYEGLSEKMATGYEYDIELAKYLI